jgi:hypothetical protein
MAEDAVSPGRERARVPRTIYRSLFIQARGALKKELIQHLRSKRRIRRSWHSRIGGQSRGQIADAISIRERPAEIEHRAIPGHWEGDLLGGTKSSHHPGGTSFAFHRAGFRPPLFRWFSCVYFLTLSTSWSVQMRAWIVPLVNFRGSLILPPLSQRMSVIRPIPTILATCIVE